MTRRPRGLALVETMIGLAIGLAVILTAVAGFQVAHRAYRMLAERVLLEERGQHALAVIAGLIRQSGWSPDDPGNVLPALSARDNCGQPQIDVTPACGRAGVAGSDALLVRFSGAGLPDDRARPDGSLVDCSGFPVAERVSVASGASAPAGYVAENLIYIAAATDGEPQLLCRYPSRHDGRIDGSAWTSGALTRGVESLQLRFGIDADGDGLVDDFVRASDVQAAGTAAWRRVLAVQIALRLRGERGEPQAATAQAGASTGTDNAVGDLPAPDTAGRPVVRQVFATTVRLRNRPCEETLC